MFRKDCCIYICKGGEKNFDSVIRKYTKVIKAAPSYETVAVHIFETEEEAVKKGIRLKKWPYIAFARARDEKGRFTKNWALILCK